MPGRAATLWQGDIWLVEQGRAPRPLTHLGDVAAIFGWNQDGSRLLFGRGRIERPHLVGDTTDLWIADVGTQQVTQLTASGKVKAASWSPVDDRIAYCELGDVLTVVTPEGEALHRLEFAICDFTWSPDGSVISLPTYTPSMVDIDGLKATVLLVWWLEDGKLQTVSDSEDETHAWPIWSTNGQRILFLRDYYAPDEQMLSGGYIWDVLSNQVKYLEGVSPSAEEMSRSPRSDLVAYRMGFDIFVMDFEGRIEPVGRGRSLLWLPDGRTLLYRDMNGNFQTVTLDVEVVESAVGGQRPAPGLYLQPEYFFSPGG
ncbi:MAG: hypothetical protein D6759_08690 [Chloroflexi bacterium]|nr:MAG: hypothetical protein D6759_08690 [Chloroflexota bacterium]